MDSIQEPNSSFQFSDLILTPPTNTSSGNHFIKYIIRDNPLYIQTPKSKIKQGIVKTGKKMYFDLIFTNEHEEFIQWIENLEIHSQKYIFSKREKWFDSTLEEHEIENLFTSILKSVKMGKNYILRVNVPSILDTLKIYDENETIMSLDDLKEDTNIISILEFQGIKCSARGFQIEIETKQILILKPVNIFDKCILSKKRDETNDEKLCSPPITEQEEIQPPTEISYQDVVVDDPISSNVFGLCLPTLVPDASRLCLPASGTEANQEPQKDSTPEPQPESNPKNELLEIDLNLEEVPSTESVVLKNRNDVYYEMYKEAIKKAKMAKNIALSSYLEAKRIKNLYMLDDLSDDDDDHDSNIAEEIQNLENN